MIQLLIQKVSIACVKHYAGYWVRVVTKTDMDPPNFKEHMCSEERWYFLAQITMTSSITVLSNIY